MIMYLFHVEGVS